MQRIPVGGIREDYLLSPLHLNVKNDKGDIPGHRVTLEQYTTAYGMWSG